jgi:hypothetical protein
MAPGETPSFPRLLFSKLHAMAARIGFETVLECFWKWVVALDPRQRGTGIVVEIPQRRDRSHRNAGV